MSTELTKQQERFAQVVAAGNSQSEAYRQAYPKSTKWKDESVWAQSSALMAINKVSTRVKEFLAISASKAMLTAADTLAQIRMLSQSDIGSIIGENGRVLLPNELDPVTRAAVASFKIDEFGRIEYKFWDKNAALEKAAKHLGLYEVDNKQKSELDGLPRDMIQAMKDRLNAKR